MLLEGKEWKARQSILQVDGTPITSEAALFQYMAQEALAGVRFLEAAEGGQTALLLAAILKLCLVSGKGIGKLWFSAVAKGESEQEAG